MCISLRCRYYPFGAHAMSAITMLGQQNGITVTDEDKEALKEAIHVSHVETGLLALMSEKAIPGKRNYQHAIL